MFHPRFSLLQSCVLTLSLLGLAASCGYNTDGDGDVLVVTSSPSTDATAGELYSYQITTVDEDGAVTYELIESPTGMTVSMTGLLEWTPEVTQLGVNQIEVKVTDATYIRRQIWTIDVNQGISMGVTLSPVGHTGSSSNQDFIDHYTEHEPYGRIISFRSAWRDDVADDGEVPELAESGAVASQMYGFTPVIGFGWTDGDGEPDLTSESEPMNNSWSNMETRNEFLAMVTDFATTYEPPYMFLGNETNTYYLTHTQGEWDDWISEFDACYMAIKAASPATVVYTTFQLERMKGLGANNGWTDPAHFDIIADHTMIDAIGFTSYPYFDYATPSAIPIDHYDEINDHWTGEVIFSEIAWPAEENAPYPGAALDQRDFIPRFFELTATLSLDYVAWLFLHDFDGQASTPAFTSVGLRSNDGSVVREAEAQWLTEVMLRE